MLQKQLVSVVPGLLVVVSGGEHEVEGSFALGAWTIGVRSLSQEAFHSADTNS